MYRVHRQSAVGLLVLLLLAPSVSADTILIRRGIVCPAPGANEAEIEEDFSTGSGSNWDEDSTGLTWSYNGSPSGTAGRFQRLVDGDYYSLNGYDPTATATATQWACAGVIATDGTGSTTPVISLRRNSDDNFDSYAMGPMLTNNGQIQLLDLVGSTVQLTYTGCGNSGLTTGTLPGVFCYRISGTDGSTTHQIWINPPCCTDQSTCRTQYTTWVATTPTCTVTNTTAGITATAAQNTQLRVGVGAHNSLDFDWFIAGSD